MSVLFSLQEMIRCNNDRCHGHDRAHHRAERFQASHVSPANHWAAAPATHDGFVYARRHDFLSKCLKLSEINVQCPLAAKKHKKHKRLAKVFLGSWHKPGSTRFSLRPS